MVSLYSAFGKVWEDWDGKTARKVDWSLVWKALNFILRKRRSKLIW